MKYMIGILVLLTNHLFSCEKCLQDIETRINIMQYYLNHTEVEQYIFYQQGVIEGLNMSCKIYNLNHELGQNK